MNAEISDNIEQVAIRKIAENETLEQQDKKEFIHRLELFLENGEYQLDMLPDWVVRKKIDNISGINFTISFEVFPFSLKAYNPIFNLFFSFEELDPYLTKEFKILINTKR
jgi:hypothetical protein